MSTDADIIDEIWAQPGLNDVHDALHKTTQTIGVLLTYADAALHEGDHVKAAQFFGAIRDAASVCTSQVLLDEIQNLKAGVTLACNMAKEKAPVEVG